MTNDQKIVQYEMQMEEILGVLELRLSELKGNLDEFDQGKQLAYTEMIDIIKTRHNMIMDVIAE